DRSISLFLSEKKRRNRQHGARGAAPVERAQHARRGTVGYDLNMILLSTPFFQHQQKREMAGRAELRNGNLLSFEILITFDIRPRKNSLKSCTEARSHNDSVGSSHLRAN